MDTDFEALRRGIIEHANALKVEPLSVIADLSVTFMTIEELIEMDNIANLLDEADDEDLPAHFN